MLDTERVQNLQAERRTREYSDGNGLSLIVYPSGKKKWFLRYTEDGKRSGESFGSFPEMSLAQARLYTNAVKNNLKDKKEVRFEEKVQEWLKSYESERPRSKRHMYTVRYRVERFILPELGGLEIKSINRPQLVRLLKDIKEQGHVETAKRVASILGQIFRYCTDLGYIEASPASELRKSISTQRRAAVHYKHLETLEDLQKTVAEIKKVSNETIRTALLLIAFSFPRVGEVLKASSSEFDFDKGLWVVPASHTKQRREHIIPLSSSLVSLLYPYVIKRHNKQETLFKISEPALINALARIAKEAGVPRTTVHGFRHIASSLLYSKGFNSLWIESALGHSDKNQVRAIYNSYDFINERRSMLEFYADLIEGRVKNDQQCSN